MFALSFLCYNACMDDASQYGIEWAADYDETDVPSDAETAAAVKVLIELAGKGPVLEVAAGTGRIAIPLARNGLKVTAADSSPEMLKILKAKDATGQVTCRIEALPELTGTAQYSMVCILLNSIWVMLEPADQRQFLHNAAQAIWEDGLIVVEMGVVDPSRWLKPKRLQYKSGSATRVTNWQPSTQRVTHTITFDKDAKTTIKQRHIRLRIIMPAELLQMAEQAGLYPLAIWSNWEKADFDAESTAMIAVFKKR